MRQKAKGRLAGMKSRVWSARSTMLVVIESLMLHPTILRAQRSITPARYRDLSSVGMYVMSALQT
jgi:hypothetical protein